MESANTGYTPHEFAKAADAITGQFLPETSLRRYEHTYEKFMAWGQQNNIPDFSENVFLAYFGELKNKYKYSTLSATYSMLKSTLQVKHNVDLTCFPKLKAFLKRASEKYEAKKKAKTLTPIEIQKFIQEASDDKFLLTKVVLAVSHAGASRRDELWKMRLEHIEDMGSVLLIKIPDRKTKIVRTLTVADEFYNLCKKYMSLRPKNCAETRFFLNYNNGKCTKQPVRLNKIGPMPQQIASFLKLPNPKAYTGHCFRRSSVAGAYVLTHKYYGGGHSSTVAEGYVNDLVQTELNISKKITDSISLQPSNQSASSATNTINIQSTNQISTGIGEEVDKITHIDTLKKSVSNDYTFEEELEIKEEEVPVEIKTEPVDENDAPTVEDPLTSPNFLAENQCKENCLHATNHYKQEKTDAVKLTKSVFDELWKGTSLLALPSRAWACHLIPSTTTNTICFAKLDLVNGKPLVQRIIVLDENSVQVFVSDEPVENSILGPLLITSVVEFESFVHAVDCLREVGDRVVGTDDA